LDNDNDKATFWLVEKLQVGRLQSYRFKVAGLWVERLFGIPAECGIFNTAKPATQPAWAASSVWAIFA
jgi:hypothetical protein